MRVLFLGENWYGSCARACCYSLRRLGCSVLDVDLQTYVPQFHKKINRGLVRLANPLIVAEYNDAVVRTALSYHPDVLLAYKAPLVIPRTLEQLRSMGITLYNYFPDPMMSAIGTMLEKTLPLYDCVFDSKKTWDISRDSLVLRRRVFLPHGYDPETCRPTTWSIGDRRSYKCNVLFVGTWSPRKERILHELCQTMPDIDLRIYGNQWREYCRARLVRSHVSGEAIYADCYAAAVCTARINLGIMGITEEMADLTSTRTYEIPACGGFMLHERNGEVAELFNEGEEIACFSSTGELAEKIKYYLGHPVERRRIAAAGHARCVPAYSDDNRMKELLRWHEDHCGKRDLRCVSVRRASAEQQNAGDPSHCSADL
jgi:glycosyltransferase involved in cell wall biosynthesis